MKPPDGARVVRVSVTADKGVPALPDVGAGVPATTLPHAGSVHVGGGPAPIGWRLEIRDPDGKLVTTLAFTDQGLTVEHTGGTTPKES